jgi:hypothetical protein
MPLPPTQPSPSPRPSPRAASIPIRSARWRGAALPTLAMLESAMAALGCASLPHAAGDAGAPNPPAPASTRDAVAPKPAVVVDPGSPRAPRSIGEPAIDGVSVLKLPAPRRRNFAVAGGGGSVDIASSAVVTMTIRGGTVDDRKVLASARKRVRECADLADGVASSVELHIELAPDGPAAKIVRRAGSEPQIAACLEETIRRAAFHPDARGRDVSVEVVVESDDAP